MKRPSISLAVFAAALATSTLVVSPSNRAEGAWKFVSKMNPRTWFQKSDEKSSTKVSESEVTTSKDAETVTVTRRHLDSDPFRLEPIGDSPVGTQVAPEIANRSSRSTAANLPVTKKPIAETSVAKNTEPSVGRGPSRPASTPSSVPAKSGTKSSKNQFVDDFDNDFARLVDSVREERAAESELAPEMKPRPQLKTVAKQERPTKSFEPESDSGTKAPLMPDVGGAEEIVERPTEVASRKITSKPDAVRLPKTLAKQPLPSDEEIAVESETAMSDTREAEAPAPRTAVAKTDSFEELVTKSRGEMDTALSRVARQERDIASRPSTNKLDVKKAIPSASVASVTKSSTPKSPTSERGGRLQAGSESPVRLLTPIDASGMIVSNELVPDRKHFTANRSFLAVAKEESTKPEISRTSSSLAATKATTSTSPIPTRSEEKDASDERGNVLILPVVKAQRATPLSNPIPNRVMSNKAPSRVVSDGIAVQRLSYEDTAAAPTESRLPLMSFGASAKSESDEGPLFILPGAESNLAAPDTSEKATAPKLIWPDEAQTMKPRKSNSRSWLPGLLLLAAVGSVIGVMIHKKRQLAAGADVGAASSGEKPAL